MKERIIPKNVVQGKRIMGFHRRNLIEGALMAFTVFLIIRAFPFVPLVRRVLSIGLGIFLLVVNGLGIKGQPFSKAILHYISYKKMLVTYSYRTLGSTKEQSREVFKYDSDGIKYVKRNKSKLEKAKQFFGY